MGLSIGGITFGLTANTTGLAAGSQAIADFGQKASASLSGVKAKLDGLLGSAKGGNELTSMMKGLTEASALSLGPLDGLTFRMRAATSVMREFGLGTGIALASIAGLTIGLTALGHELVKQTIAIQQAHMTLQGITGSSVVASGEIQVLRDVAKQAGFAFTDLAPNFARFVASASGAGQSLAVTNQEFKELALLTGTLHLSSQEMNNVMMAFDHMLSMGRVQGQQLRQLFNNMPAVFTVAQRAAKDMGIDLSDAMHKGTVASGEFLQHFLADADKMFNIQLDKPIISLQASIGRVKGSWQEFVVSFGEALDAGNSFMNVFERVSGLFDYLTLHIHTVVNVLGALAGALAGAASAFIVLGAVSFVTSLFIGLAEVITTVASAFALVTNAAEIFTAAELAMSAVMSATPIGAVLTGLSLLAAALFGAKLGFDAVNNVQNQFNHQMVDTTGMEMYIANCKQMKEQTDQLTESFIKNTKAKLLQNVALMQGTSKDLSKAMEGMKNPQLSFLDQVGMSMAGDAGGAVDMTQALSDKQKDAAVQVMLLSKNLTEQASDVNLLAHALKGLVEVSKLPNGTTLAASNPHPPKSKDPDRGLRTIEDLVNKAADARQKLELLFAGPQNSGLLDSLDEAKKKLFDLKPDQLAQIDRLMGHPGEGSNLRLQNLTTLIENTKIATETTKEFNKVWDDIQKGNIALKGMNDQLDFLRAGGDPDKIWFVEASKKAQDILRQLTTQDLPTLKNSLESLTDPKTGNKIFGKEAIDNILNAAKTDSGIALEAVRKALAGIGIDGATAEEAMTNFEKALMGTNDQVSKFTSLAATMQKNLRDIGSQRIQLQAAMAGANIDTMKQLDYIAQAAETLRNLSPDNLVAINNQLAAAGINGQNATEKWANMLKQIDLNKQALDDWNQLLTTNENAWVQWGNNSVDAIEQVLTGTMKLRDGIKAVFLDLSKTILDTAIFNPVKSMVTRGIKNLFEGATNASSNPLDASTGNATTAAFNQLVGVVSNTSGVMNTDFLSGLIRSALGLGIKMTAEQTHTVALAESTFALYAFATAVTAATAASGASAASDTLAAIAAAAVSVSTGGQVLRRFAAGGPSGYVSGPGTGTSDSILARISNGEFIVNAEATKRNLSLLHAINSNKVTGFAGGGPVNVNNLDSLYVPGLTNADPIGSQLISPQGPAIIDARSEFHLHGDVSEESFDRVKQYADARDARLRSELPYLIDQRVSESRVRGRMPR